VVVSPSLIGCEYCSLLKNPLEHAILTSVARQNLERASSLITKTLEQFGKLADPNSCICDICGDERAIIYSADSSGNITSNAMADDWVVGVIRWLFSFILDMNVCVFAQA
jgi:hypothetical protein